MMHIFIGEAFVISLYLNLQQLFSKKKIADFIVPVAWLESFFPSVHNQIHKE